MHVPRTLRGALVAAAAPALLGAVSAVPSAAAVERPVDPVVEWYDVTARFVSEHPVGAQGLRSAIWATTWRAVDEAVDPTLSSPEVDAVIAQAAHDVLVSVDGATKAQVLDVDRALRVTLSRVPSDVQGEAVDRGRAAAAAVLAERSGDGLTPAQVNVAYTFPTAPQPGEWQATGSGPAVQPGLGRARPYLLPCGQQGSRSYATDCAAGYRPPAAPALTSPQYVAEWKEVRDHGSATGSVRTPEQTQVAKFWIQSSLGAYTRALRAALTEVPRAVEASTDERARTVALFHAATADAQIAVFEAKYHYLRWRPLTAIREAGTDGNPRTSADPSWTPLATTPMHPEYPGGHATYAGAAQEALERLVGDPTAGITLTDPQSGAEPRSYTAWSTATRENVDARVWQGLHFRSADEVGAALGRQVARDGLTAAGVPSR